MIYPYLTLNDGTEYTHSEMGTVNSFAQISSDILAEV